MNIQVRSLAPVLVSLLFVTAGAPWLNAQVTDPIRVHVDHSFIIGNTTLPPGEYTFRIMPGSDFSVMTATSENDKTTVDFVVREAVDDHRPSHSELVFKKYGNTDFLSKIFEGGSKTGVAVMETSRQEARLAKNSQHAMEHTEEQK